MLVPRSFSSGPIWRLVRRRAERLSQLLFLAGVGFGLYGLGQWLFGLQELLGREATGVHFRASGSFGNRNHYAAFMEMLLLCGLGWVGMRRAGFHARGGGSLARGGADGGRSDFGRKKKLNPSVSQNTPWQYTLGMGSMFPRLYRPLETQNSMTQI